MKILKNLLISFLIGVGIGSLVELSISYLLGEIIVGVPNFFEGQSNLVNARAIELVLYGGFGLVGALGRILYDIDKFSLLAATSLHLLLLLIYYSFVGFYLCWFSNFKELFFSNLLFILIFLVIWSGFYFYNKRRIEKINKDILN
ncbi:DUF3021 domain-containing protein [Peptoniphilus raoultii]|uniref:DUF3021 domain-containing protein n=1 Tax=Peptoniphilus raoultii TaxID=1776387 RepID=UPI0008D90F28|nr:DUF3021 domain-containing protein [Peptoniphilus raoultii]